MSGHQEQRERIARALDFPTGFDARTFDEWKQAMAGAVLDSLGLEQVGWLWRKFDSAVWRHTPVDQDWADLSRHHPLEHLAVYRLRGDQ